MAQHVGHYQAGGGTLTHYTDVSGSWAVHTFTSTGSSSFTCRYGLTADILVVAGGGGGGYDVGGGGGAGGMAIWQNASISPGNHAVIVGDGGGTATANSHPGYSGESSRFGTFNEIYGGGGGGSWAVSTTGATGGSSGGHAGWSHSNGTSTTATYSAAGVSVSSGSAGTAYGSVGGYNTANASNTQGAGGGGAGGVGGNAITHGSTSGRTENGGAGLANNFRNGSDVTYARGGCGGNDAGGGVGFRGDGDANTGEGGAGAGGSTAHAGGSGIVIIRYKM